MWLALQKLFNIQNKILIVIKYENIKILIVIGQLPQKKLGDLLTWALRTNVVSTYLPNLS